MKSMNLIIVLLMSVKRLSKALSFFTKHTYIHNTKHMHITSVTGVGKILFLFLVVVSVIINEILVLKVLNC